MVHFLSDGVAMKWGRKCNLGRGLPIILTPEGKFMFGFHPKFKNDQRQFNNVKEFSETEMLHIMLKYSGFLGQVLAWNVGSSYYWTAVAKNSTDNQYSNDCMRLVDPFMTDKLVIEIVTNGLYFCGEVISNDDISHGTVPISEGFVCTCVGRTQTEENPVRYTDIMNHTDMHRTCLQLNIPVPELWIVNDNPLEFAKKLAVIRDTVTMSTLRTFLNDNCTSCLSGTVLHEDLLGNDIEGLVMWKITAILSEACKYKFPIYTKETFGNRTFLSSNSLAKMMSMRYYQHVLAYLDFWVTTREGRDYWANWLFCSALVGRSFTAQASNVALHLQLSLDTDREFNPSVDYRTEFMKEIGMPSNIGTADVYVVVGPIGSGKSTTADYISASIPGSYHIDGDHLCQSPDGTNMTLSLGQERNLVTLSKIASVIFEGKVPVISCGGGVLFQGFPNPSFFLREYLLHTLGIKINLILYLPGEISELEEIYRSWKVESIIKYRLETGAWSTKGKNPTSFIDGIQKISEYNLRFAQLLAEFSDECITYTPIVYPNTKAVTTVPTVINSVGVVPNVHYSQFRVLAHVATGDRIGHITLDFTNKLHSISGSDFVNLRDYITGKSFPATIVTYKGSSKKETCSFLSLDTSTELSELLPFLVSPLRNNPAELHVTINSGQHEPAAMRDACIQYHANPNSVTIPTRKKEMFTYSKAPTLVTTTLTMLDLAFTV